MTSFMLQHLYLQLKTSCFCIGNRNSKGECVMETVKDYFGSLVFDDRVMKATLSDKVYASLKKNY